MNAVLQVLETKRNGGGKNIMKRKISVFLSLFLQPWLMVTKAHPHDDSLSRQKLTY